MWGYSPPPHYSSSLCHHVVTGRIISKTRSKENIIFIESCQLPRGPKYGTGIKMAYFDYNNKWRLSIIVRISSCELFFIFLLVL